MCSQNSSSHPIKTGLVFSCILNSICFPLFCLLSKAWDENLRMKFVPLQKQLMFKILCRISEGEATGIFPPNRVARCKKILHWLLKVLFWDCKWSPQSTCLVSCIFIYTPSHPLAVFLILTPLVELAHSLIFQMQDKSKDLTHPPSHCRNSAALLLQVLFQ